MLAVSREYLPMKSASILLLLFLLTGCISAELRPLAYKTKIAVKSDISATVELAPDIFEGKDKVTLIENKEGVLVPISKGPYPDLHFNLNDQKTFISSLQSTLVASDMLKIDGNYKSPYMKIKIFFVSTRHIPEGHVYILDVVMKITFGSELVAYKYKIISSEGDTMWERLNTNVADGKEKAGEKLLSYVVKDIEKVVSNVIKKSI